IHEPLPLAWAGETMKAEYPDDGYSLDLCSSEQIASTYRSNGYRPIVRWLRAIVRAIVPGVFLLLLSSCTPEGPVASPPGLGQITQVSVINALMAGHYDGVMPISELRTYGDFGLGTLDHLDGELILLNGHAYQVHSDGVVSEVASDRATPFAV